ncbi:MAG: glycosyltransferase family 2 protein [Halanaerobiales bacterium]
MREIKSVSIIMPVYNEEENIADSIFNLNFPWIREIIVVDDGSEDNTSEIASKFPVKLITLNKNRGKGEAVSIGYDIAGGDLIALLDGDLGKSIKETKKLVEPFFENSEIDCTIGVMDIKGGGLGIVRFFSVNGLKLFTGRTLNAPLSGQRVFKRDVFKKLLPLSSGFGLEMGLNFSLIKNDFNIKEIKCAFSHDVTGLSFTDINHRFSQLIDIGRVFWKRGMIAEKY